MEDYIEFRDYLCFNRDKTIRSIISNEQLLFSDKLTKLLFFYRSKQVNLIVTDKAVYYLDNKILSKRMILESTIGITINESSNELIIHRRGEENDQYYETPRKNELIMTIAEAYYKLTNKKLKFSIVKDEKLSSYVTYTKQKKENPDFTLMKDNYSFIEDIIKTKDIKNEETPKGKSYENEKENEDDEKQNLEKKEEKLKENMNEMGIEKGDFNFNLDFEKNPFKGVLIGGAAATGAGAAAVGGSIAACIVFDSVFLASTAGEIFAAGFAFLGGFAVAGIGIVIAIPSLLGFGAYKIYKTIKEKKRKEFFESFKLDKMIVEREFQFDVINKIEEYFNNGVNIEKIKPKIDKCLNSIIEIYISIDNKRLLDLDNQKLLQKMNKDNEIMIKNIPKIRQELMKAILFSTNKDIVKTFEEGIPLFKEFIQNFGPLNIEEENKVEIDKLIENIILEMKYILEKKMNINFQKFDPKVFYKLFDVKLENLYEEKKKVDNITKSDFISNCKDFIVEPIADNAKNYGILSLFFKFTIIIKDIAVKKKSENYKKKKEDLKQKYLNDKKEREKEIETKKETETKKEKETETKKEKETETETKKEKEIEKEKDIQNSGFIYNQNLDMWINVNNGEIFNPKKQMCYNPSSNNWYKNEEIMNLFQKMNIQNLKITFLLMKISKYIDIQGNSDMTIEILISKLMSKLGDEKIVVNKLLINDKIELNPTSKEKLKDLGIDKDVIIMVYYE